MRKKTNLLATCSTSGSLTTFLSREEIATEKRRADFLRSGCTAGLYSFEMGVQKAVKEFRQGK